MKRFNKATNSENERTKLLLDATPLACRLWNRSFEIFKCNEESIRLFQLNSDQEFISRYFDLSPEFQPDGKRSIEKAKEMLQKAFDGERIVLDWIHQMPDGTQFPTEITLIRVPYEGDFAVAGYTRDLREQKKMMEEIERRDELLEAALKEAQTANRAKSDFLANMSHEMRTPLNAVIGLSELSLGADRVEGEDRSNLEKIYSAGTTLLNLINDILDISKIEAGMLELVEVDYDVPSLINDTVTQNMIRIGEKPIEFNLEIGKDAFLKLNGDELRIKQIMNNLLSNAIKYTNEGTVELVLKCARANDIVWLTIAVRDTGRGIKSEEIDKLFMDYARLDVESNRQIEGSGLGLPITRRLAEMMGGSIEVESEYGKGSVFTVTIKQKFVSETRISEEIVNSLKSFRYFVSKRDHNAAIRLNVISMPYARVLVVDDNTTNLDVAKGLMGPYKMKIDCVESGQKAVDAIRAENNRYDAVFMDHMMPGMDGIEAARAIRALGTEYAKNIPIIAMTANTIIGTEEMFLNEGFQAFLSKPIDISMLDLALRRWVRDREREKQHEEQYATEKRQNYEDALFRQERREVSERRSGIERRKLYMKFVGLDIDKGMERFGGSEETYISVLRSYAKNTRPLLASIEGVSEDTLDEYATIVHGIKGSSRGILADMIGDSAEGLENAARTGDFRYVSEHNRIFLEAVRKLITDIEEVVSAINAEHPKPQKEKPDRESLLALLVACRAYSMDGAEEAMAEIDAYQYELDDGLVDWLHENLKLTNFKQIIEYLSGLL